MSNFVSVSGKGKNLSGAPERRGLYEHNVSPLKVKGVTGLLSKSFGESWQLHEELKYFSDFLRIFQDKEKAAVEQEECGCCKEGTSSVRINRALDTQ